MAVPSRAPTNEDQVSNDVQQREERLVEELTWFMNTRTGEIDTAYLSPQVVQLCKSISSLTDKFTLAQLHKSVTENPHHDPSWQSLNSPISETWDTRDKSLKESPVDFIKRVYGSRLDGYFTIADLTILDSKLHRAFYNWIGKPGRSRPPLSELNLPTKQEVNDRLLHESKSEADSSRPDFLRNASPEIRARAKLKDVLRERSQIVSTSPNI